MMVKDINLYLFDALLHKLSFERFFENSHWKNHIFDVRFGTKFKNSRFLKIHRLRDLKNLQKPDHDK